MASNMEYRRFSSLRNSFAVTVSLTPIATTPAGSSGRKRSPTILPAFVEVIVGRHEELRGWYSPDDELKRISFFDRFLKSDALSGKDDPSAFGQVLHFIRTGKMQYQLATLCKHNNKANHDDKIYYAKSGDMVKTYVMAKKFGLEELANAACDQLRNALPCIHLTSGITNHIVDHCEPSDPLFRLSMQSLAVNIHHIGWSRWRVNNNSWFNAFCDDRPTNAQLIADELQKYEGADYPPVGDGICQWHIHTTTKACEAPRTEPEVDMADMRCQEDPVSASKVGANHLSTPANAVLSLEDELEDDLVVMKQFEWGSYACEEILCDPVAAIEIK